MPEEREDVEATLEQSTTPGNPQQKRKRRAIDWIAGSTLVAEALLSIIWAIVWACGCRFEHQLQVYLALVLIILTGGYLALIFCPIFKKDDDPRWFHARILSSGIVGGSYAFLLPAVMSLEEGSVTSGGAAALRQAILLATGGLIGLIALGETRRKNDNDREAAENLRTHQQDMLNQQKKQFRKQIKKQQQQFEANAFKERKAERRERYTNAVEQLGDEKAPIRMGGVYTLVGLVDEWLEEESLEKYEDRLKEGQVIINNLCAYIRSPLTLATRYDELDKDSPTPDGVYKDNQQEFYTDKAEFKAEKDVRLGIIKEIHDRLQGLKENTPGKWSDFEYNFSGSIFFYPVDLTNSYYTKSVNFSGSTYKGEANFSGSTYKGEANFSNSAYEKGVIFSTSDSRSTYEGKADFSGSTYEGEADFSRSTYRKRANFHGSTYYGRADFSRSTYEEDVTFSTSDSDGSTYYGWADFSGSTYEGEADFSRSTYQKGANFRLSTYEGEADFSHSTYEEDVTFSISDSDGSTYEGEGEGEADFSDSTYRKRANFLGSTYYGLADFSGSTYEEDVTFSTSDSDGSTYYGWADFSGSTYEGEADFSRSTYQKGANFRLSTYEGEADFSHSTYEEDVTFSISDSDGSTYEGEGEGEADFSDSTYRKRANFLGSTYYGLADFSGSTYEEDVTFSTSNIDTTYIYRRGILLSASSFRSTYLGRADFSRSTYKSGAYFTDSTYENETDFSGSIFYQETYFVEDRYSNSSSCFTNHAPQFYDKKKRKNTLFGSHNNDFTVDIDKGYPIDLDSKGIPLNCKFLTSEQKEYLADKFQEIGKTQNRLLEVKDPKEKAELSKKLQTLNEELHEWREEATTVKVEDMAAEDTES